MDSILKTHFDKFRDKGELPPELRESECKNGCKLFSDSEKLKLWRNNLKGISFKDKEGNELHGAVDNLLQKGKKIIVLDIPDVYFRNDPRLKSILIEKLENWL